MRHRLAAAATLSLGLATAATAQQPTSAPVQVVLTAHKAGTLALGPLLSEAASPSATARPALQAAWNLPPAFAGHLSLRARRMGASPGATYIDVRVLPAEQPSHADVVLADAAPRAGTVHVVRLVVY